MKQKTIFIASLVVLALIFIFGIQMYRGEQAEQATQTVTKNQEALVRFHSPSLGPASAPVHVVEFLDPVCEGCRAFYPFVKDMMAANPNDIRLTIRYAPFHRGSEDIVRVLEAARKQGKYWETLEALFASQPEWTRDHTAVLDLTWPVLESVGLDLARLKEDMKSPEIDKILQQDTQDLKTLNVSKTPEFFVNGRPLPSFGAEQLQQLVEEELAKAKSQNR
jgi:protein-disulfide isomerase